MGGFLSRGHDPASPPEVDLEEANRLSSASIYSDLKPGFIRIVTILPSQDRSDPIDCILAECPLAIPPAYKALSYTWGSKSNPGEITINKTRFLVTRNLLIALVHLRDLGFHGPLWIDAICINQIDIPERDSQVEQMRTIYAKAALVLVWLGPRAEKSDSVMHMLAEAEVHRFSTDWINTLLQNSTYEDHFLPLADLLLRSYWERLWIVQEIAYARDALILCGLRQISYPSLLKFLEALHAHAIDETVSQSKLGRIIRLFLPGIGPATLLKPGSARLEEYENPILLLRMHAITKKCRDPRDKVFGTYGLFGPDLRQRVTVDYSRPADEVMKTAAKAIIEVTHRLDILCVQTRIKTYTPGSWQDKLPSWVPPWDARTENALCTMIYPEYRFLASGSREARCRYFQEDSILQATGLSVGQITKILPRSFGPDRWLYGDEDDLVKLVKYTITCRSSLGDQVKSLAALAAFWSTLFCGYWEWQYFPRARAMYGENLGYDNIFQLMVTISNEFDKIQNLVESRSGTYQLFNIAVQHLWKRSLFNQYQVTLLENLYRSFKDQLFFHFQRAEGMERTEVDMTAQSEVPPFDIGVCPDSAQEGDHICVLLGCKTPVILRPVGENFKLVSNVYVTGFMYGEALRRVGDGFEGMREFLIE